MRKVLLVDDEVMLLDSLEIILSFNDMEIIGKATDGNAALDILKEKKCDIALVDLNMKGMGGIELIGHMKQLYPEIKILVLTTFYDDKNITEAISNGAEGYLLKDSGKDAILGAVDQIMGGSTVLDKKVMERLTALVANNAAALLANDNNSTDNAADDHAEKNIREIGVYGELTEREREIASLIVDGFSNKQIADKLYISEGTVKNYISKIYDKTGIHDRVKLVVALKG
ncbi:DNA-binding response regulator, NarL/FixJ family, contains REC and HTH domains [Eubacterium ruminantium]|uniref:Stage 0 sporulation protein A homolog n=1 Tax=Eubacterium ruminantium TaxID=42322 RepID=A0A1T4KGY0_9FIRM|nr:MULTISPECIES: response regulator transcription factor [Eubacterium]SCW31981.1 DNA-binding response regulator, NarL/FixJ family, contains REC and HTH domains [Eubacterium ruminantium]SDM26945.1 two component transcriptional regulator, LuxR family [Eubacterium ruminantium]SJZ41680.1 two component transcriptional regulator, LuxR family [Eubacterium ruminantium]